MPTDFKDFSIIVTSSQPIDCKELPCYCAMSYGDLLFNSYPVSCSIPFRGWPSIVWNSDTFTYGL